VEEWRDGALRRTLRLPHGTGIVALRPADGHVEARLSLADLRDLGTAVHRCRWLLDLDADPVAVDAALSADPLLAPLVEAVPGRRVPRCVDGPEFAVRAVLGTDAAALLVKEHGEPVSDPDGGLTHAFPDVATLAAVDPIELAADERAARSFRGLVAALADGTLDLGVGADWAQARQRLRELPELAAPTVELIAMRALGDPDAWPGAGEASPSWPPWAAYAFNHLHP
jgi:AraC family transcriptional regulator of adaptative response / DNA-3-methyladenine glycosylase II